MTIAVTVKRIAIVTQNISLKCSLYIAFAREMSFYSVTCSKIWKGHYCNVVMGVMACQITSLAIVYSTVYSDVDQRKHQSSASLAFVRGIHQWPVNSPHKWPVTRKMFPFDDVIMELLHRNGPLLVHIFLKTNDYSLTELFETIKMLFAWFHLKNIK